MALFGKKKVECCAICGKETKMGLFSGLLKNTIEGQYVCNDCYGTIDLPNGRVNEMTLVDFRQYMVFRDENQKLRDKFKVTGQVDFGAFDTKFMFDTNNRLFCMNKNLSTTIFEGKHIRSFMITEDTSVIMEGSAEGLVSYESAIPEQLTYLAPEVEEFRRRKEQFRRRLQNLPEERRDEFKKNEPKFDVLKPFQCFNIEIQFDHPYWGEFRADMGAPSFNTNDPDVRDYLRSYREKVNTLKELARLLMDVAFPSAGERYVDPVSGNRFTGAAVDTATELRRYKELLDSGIITEAEFTIKKRQLLGM